MSAIAILNARLLDPATDYDGPGAVLAVEILAAATADTQRRRCRGRCADLLCQLFQRGLHRLDGNQPPDPPIEAFERRAFKKFALRRSQSRNRFTGKPGTSTRVENTQPDCG